MSERPYIGVTGPTTTEEVDHLAVAFKDNGLSLESAHQPMIGFLLSYKTLNGGDTTNRRYPSFRNIPTLLEGATETFTTVHYNSRQLSDLSDQIKTIFSGGIYRDGLCRGLQLNIPWPPVEEIKKAKDDLPDLKIIMQLSHGSVRGRSPVEVAKLLAGYEELSAHTLIDLSGGKAIPFALADVLPYYLAIKDRLPDLTVGLAGGFTGENVQDRCRQIMAFLGTKNFSIDAEGGLRDKITDEYGDDVYNSDKVSHYVKKAAATFG